MEKNKIYVIEIDDMGNDGEGIGHIEGMAVFVKDTVIGDIANVKIIKLKKNYAFGRLMDIIKPSAFRVDPLCHKARSCGGCALMHISYEKQLEYKNDKVLNCLKRIGGITSPESIMEPIIGMEYPYYYRNKMQLPVRRSKDGQVQIGFFAGRTHSIINIDDCYIGHPVNKLIIKALREFMEKFNISTYDEETGKGLVRHILTRVGFVTKEVMVCLIINGSKLPYKEVFIEMMSDAICDINNSKNESVNKNPNDSLNDEFDLHNERKTGEKLVLKSLSINFNKENTNKILGDKVEILWGNDYITDYIGDVKFQISPLSFYQVNPVQTKILYEKAMEYADLSGDEVVWDLYCGIGTISLFLAKRAKKVYGVEIVPEAIADATENARINKIDNVEFLVGKAEDVVIDAIPDIIVVDPPRKGCDGMLLDTILKVAPKRIVYVSCDPATLARDIKILVQGGYELKRAVAVDQFGHSGHVETVCLLSRKA